MNTSNGSFLSALFHLQLFEGERVEVTNEQNLPYHPLRTHLFSVDSIEKGERAPDQGHHMCVTKQSGACTAQ